MFWEIWLENYRPGPAILVTAAFVGPGTVLAASKAGAEYGFTLLWAVVFSVFTAIVLQEMAARLGIASGNGLAQALKDSFSSVPMRIVAVTLVLAAILFGNTAYQTGNIVGAVDGINILTGLNKVAAALIIAIIALAVVFVGKYSLLQWSLTFLVAVMGLVFVVAAIACWPDLKALGSGLRPNIPDQSAWIVIGLIGTTVVPYNLFLHASASAQRYRGQDDKSAAIRNSLLDTVIAIAVGGVITASLLITAAATFEPGQLSTIRSIAEQLRPSLGDWAESFFAVGLFSAGLTSSITAPIAAGYAAAGCFGWPASLADIRLKLVASAVILSGLLAATQFGESPQEAILVAQIANGLLLPIVAFFLLYAVNNSKLMAGKTNGWLSNTMGLVVVLITVIMAVRQFNSVWQKIAALWAAG